MNIDLATIGWWTDNTALAGGALGLLILTLAAPLIGRKLRGRAADLRAVRRERRAWLRDQQQVAETIQSLLHELNAAAAAVESRTPATAQPPACTDGPVLTAPDAAGASDPHPALAGVYALADRGQRPMQIAHSARMPLGEVELILNLRHFELRAGDDRARAAELPPVLG